MNPSSRQCAACSEIPEIMRIAIVNDLSLAVETLSRVIRAMPAHQIAWVAVNGAEALAKCHADMPDLILMDLLMPIMDGVEATRRIMAEKPCAILVVTASLAGNQAKVFDAIAAGALDAARTPEAAPEGSLEKATGLRDKINVIARLIEHKTTMPPPPPPPPPQASGNIQQLKTAQHAPCLPCAGANSIVAIGASTGGPKALAAILHALPPGLPAAIVAVQHLDDEFIPGLIEWLTRQANMPVMNAIEGDYPRPGRFYLAAGNANFHLTPARTFAFAQDSTDTPYRPSIDVFFNSLAQNVAMPCLAILLTGMGRDGALGLLNLRRAGWHTIAQDQATSTIFGMPKAAAQNNAAAQILPLSAMADAIIENTTSKPRKTTI